VGQVAEAAAVSVRLVVEMVGSEDLVVVQVEA
jgi:hypothetical protein